MKKYMDDLECLVSLNREMCENTVNLLNGAVECIKTCNGETVGNVCEMFERQTYLDNLIEEESIRILTLYQPTAVDIRTIASIMKSITYMERIGKYSKNIATMTGSMAEMKDCGLSDRIKEMTDVAKKMVGISINGLMERTVEEFEELKGLDDRMDHLRDKVLEISIKHAKDDSGVTEECMMYASMSRYLERIGDHACKIAEKVTFLVTGKHVEIDR